MLVLSLILAVTAKRQAITPYVVTALELAEGRGASYARTAALCVLSAALGLAVAIPVTLWSQYQHGVYTGDHWGTRFLPQFAFDGAVLVRNRLASQGILEESEALRGLWDRARHITPDAASVTAFAIGLVLVPIFAAGRLRFARWPVHPVMFLVAGTYPARCFAVSFLLGCLVKVIVTKYGASRLYHRLKPLMIGLIAGDMLGGLLPILFGYVYFAVTGEPGPEGYRVLPG